MSRTLRLVVAMCSVSGGTGCSFLFVQRAPERAEAGGPVACTTSRAAPVIDTLSTAAYVAMAVGAASSRSCRPDEFGCFDVVDTTRVAIASAVLAAIHGASAAYGWSATSRCSDVIEGRGVRDVAPQPEDEAIRQSLLRNRLALGALRLGAPRADTPGTSFAHGPGSSGEPGQRPGATDE
jgi:hypothetical protein